MAALCLVKFCNTSSGKFYQIPNDSSDEGLRLRKKWLELIGKDPGESGDLKFVNHEGISCDYIICEKHFSEKQFELKDGIHKLKLDAVPDLHLVTGRASNPAAKLQESPTKSTITTQYLSVPCTQVLRSKPPNIQLASSQMLSPSLLSTDQKICVQAYSKKQNPTEPSTSKSSYLQAPMSSNVVVEGQKIGQPFVLRTIPTAIQHLGSHIPGHQNLILLPNSSSNTSQSPTAKVVALKRLPIHGRSPKIPTSTIIKPKISLIPKTGAVLKSKISVPAEERRVTTVTRNKEPNPTASEAAGKKQRLLAPKPYTPVTHFCRLCAEVNIPMVDIYSPQGAQLNLVTMMSYVMQFQVNKTDRLPLRVCLNCIKKLHFCYENIRDFTEANQKLVELLKEEDEMLKRGPEQPIPLLLIENNDSNPASQSEEPKRLRIINEKLVQVDKSLPTPEQIAQVIETVKAGLGTDSNTSLSTLFHTSPKQLPDHQEQEQDPSKTFKCSVCSESLPDYFTLIQHQLLKYQCRTCKSRFCSYKSRRAHYRDLHQGIAKFFCPKCKLGFVTKRELLFHKKRMHPLFCECCSKTFISKLALSAHVKLRMKNKKCGPNCTTQPHSPRDKDSYSCEDCDMKFESKNRLKAHNEHHIEGYFVPRYECKHCTKRFSVQNKLNRHMKFHMEKQIQCPICPRKFTINTELKYHMEVHANERKFECDFCTSKFLHKVHLIKHIRNKHLQQNYFLCQICEAKFDTKSEVETHCASHTIKSKVNHLTLYKIITPFQCDICSKFYSTKYSLDKHLQRHKDKELGLYLMCEFCGQHFASKSRLQSHLREHATITDPAQTKPKANAAKLKRYSCQVCSQRYSTTVQLLAHMACHTGIKPFKCSYCEATFTTKMNKNNHELKHKGIKNYVCEYCQKAFYAHYNLVLHMRTHTKEKPYKCTYCPKAFPRRSNLTTHLRVHTGDRPYVCNVCDHAFTQKTSRDKHLLIHTQQRMYQCEQCEFSFNRKKELTDHISNVHSISNIEEMFMPKDSVIISDETDHMEEAKFQIQIIEQEVVTYDEHTGF